MRYFSFVFLFIFSLNVAAQSPMVSRLFSDGTRYANQQDFDAALRSYKTALFAAENEYLNFGYRARLHYNIGVCHFRLNRFKLAANEFKSAILLKKDYSRAHYALGMTRMRLREWKDASASFESLLREDPKNGEGWFDLAFAKIAVGEMDAARSAFGHAIEFGTIDTPLSHNNIGVILAIKGELIAAEKEFETAIALSGGRLIEAKRNLESCRVKRAGRPELIAKDFQYVTRDSAIDFG